MQYTILNIHCSGFSQIPQEKDMAIFSTGTYPPLGCRYTGIVRNIHESRQKNFIRQKMVPKNAGLDFKVA